jgi:hypothetical protein
MGLRFKMGCDAKQHPLASQSSRGAAARKRDAGETERVGLWGRVGRGLRNEGKGFPPIRHFGQPKPKATGDPAAGGNAVLPGWTNWQGQGNPCPNGASNRTVVESPRGWRGLGASRNRDSYGGKG